MSLTSHTLHEAQAARKAGASSEDLVQAQLQAIATWEPHLNAYLEVLAEQALAQARRYDQENVVPTDNQPLAGIPIAVKDIICTTEGHTTAASRILVNYRAPYDATVITRLKQAGAIVIGKTNLDEFAMGSSTEYSAYDPVLNPYDTSRVAGGSSGGSAAAVAAGTALAALGTDTGGSIRLPASFCGVVGLKPTYGRVSRFGAIAYGSSLDQIGTFTRTVADTALLLELMAGQDEYDATLSRVAVPRYTEFCGQDIKGMRIGVPQEFFTEGVSIEVAATVRQAITDLTQLGAEIVDISLPLTPAGIAVYFLIAKAEASTNLARFDGLRYAKVATETQTLLEHYLEVRGHGFGPEVKRAILMGTYALSAGYYEAWYQQASKVRTLIRREYEAAFQKVDIIAAPVAPETAFPLGSKTNDPLAMYLSDALTVTLNVAGVPAISVPCGVVAGLPVGLQLAAPHFEEARLLQVAHAYEQSHEWYRKQPALPTTEAK